MSRKEGYTTGKTRGMKKVPVEDELFKLVSHDAIETERTITQVVFLILCQHYKRDPSDPSRSLADVKLKAAS